VTHNTSDKTTAPPSLSGIILDKLVPDRLFARLSIAHKMFLAYMILVLLTVVVVAYALLSLHRINTLNRNIVRIDITVEEAADKMLDALLGQDMYEKRFLILKSRDMQNLFAKRGQEFTRRLDVLKTLPVNTGLPLDTIEASYASYNRLFQREVQLVRSGDVAKATALSDHELKAAMDKLLDTLRPLSVRAKEAQDDKMRRISDIGGTAYTATALLCLFSIIVGAIAGLVVTHHIASSIHKLKVATEHIAEGHFDYDPCISSEDEIGGLSRAFLAMGKRLRKLEEMYLDASPLTRLPGGIAIETVLKKRIDAGRPIAFCVLDLDNFKAFNDRYGYANGSEVIKESAKIIEAAVREKGTPEDFIGHIGGDDFVVITVPSSMRDVAGEIISSFDRRIAEFYDPDDRKLGYILGKTRQGVEMQFPLMTISIAIVTNEHRKLVSPLEASETAAELKDYAKTIPRSVFVIDKRRHT
jgi:GGDEF domain-containing protein/CHASE3 domain sensor protein